MTLRRFLDAAVLMNSGCSAGKRAKLRVQCMNIRLPPLIRFAVCVDGNPVSQILVPETCEDFTVAPYDEARVKGFLLEHVENERSVLLVTNNAKPRDEFNYVIRKVGFELDSGAASSNLKDLQWERHSLLPTQGLNRLSDYEAVVTSVRESWAGKFAYSVEDLNVGKPGLRPPQIGAIHAAQSHFTVHRHPATIVLPTGTGKTETMLSVLVAERCERLLVVVPTDALRTQISNKFQTLGVLKQFGIVLPDAQFPIVGVLKHRFKTSKNLNSFIRKCNVVVATMPLVGGWDQKTHKQLASLFSHLFIDEAHHLGAPSWEYFREAFSDCKILQFTATPYRNDGKLIGGQPIFNYPLAQAQKDGYFKPINFRPVIEFDPKKRDRAIAEAAVEQLRNDLKKGHMLMARVRDVPRAREVFEIYEEFSEFNPVQIHTGLGVREREATRQKILNKEARILVCVDMLGEGFDLPELKIAAFHDIRQSLPITLQLAGRFTRSRPDLGDATFIANIADVSVKEELRKLYQRDVDWNQLLPLYSDAAIAEEFDLWEFLGGFKKFPNEISLQNVNPALSAVAYKTKCKEWLPENFAVGIPGYGSLDRSYFDINAKEDTLVVLTTKRIPLKWAQIDDIYSWDWQLYILFWDRSKELLFIHNSSNSGFFKDLAKAVCGDEVKIVGGPEIFRCLATVNRLRLNNVGLLEQLGRFIRFTMRAGSDVESGLSEAQRQHAVKSNLFGTGFENGQRTSIGCSYKGRIWSHQTTNLRELKRWCQVVGSKLVDKSLDPNVVLEGTLRPESVATRPDSMPIAVDWPDFILRDMNRPLQFRLGKREAYFQDLDLSVKDPDEKGELKIILSTRTDKVVVGLELFKSGDSADFRFVPKVGAAYVSHGDDEQTLESFFTENPPTIWFADGTSLCGSELVQLPKKPNPFPKKLIETWDWNGVDITKESQGIERQKDSIQYYVINRLKNRKLTVLFDDDDSGESADVVAIVERKSAIDVEFYHCKFSSDAKPGARIEDLYAVCGQAQKSVRWMEQPTDLFTHLLKREPREYKGKTGTRFEVGSDDDLWRIREKSRRSRVNLKISVVQPGVSKAKVSRSQLELLSVTENYLKETFMVSFSAITSE